MRQRLCGTLPLLVVLLTTGAGSAQDALPFRPDFDPQTLVEFNFTNSDIGDVVRHFVRSTGWSVFYDPAQVRGKVTIVTPGQIPLAQATRLLQGVIRTYGQAIQVLTPNSPQPVPLATALAELFQASERRDVLVWSSSNARDPQSRPCVCDPQGTPYPLGPFGGQVIIDERR
jgi:type II secretory pathway component GspD/PulD (secretin)